MNNEEILEKFLKDELIVFRGWYSTKKIIEDFLNIKGSFNETLNIAYFPSKLSYRHSSAFIYYYLAISKKSDYQILSRNIIEYLVSEEFQKDYSNQYYHVSPLKSVIDGIIYLFNYYYCYYY